MVVTDGSWCGAPVSFVVDTGACGELRLAPRDASHHNTFVRRERQLVLGPLGERTHQVVAQVLGRLDVGATSVECLATVDSALPHTLLPLTVLYELFPSGVTLSVRDRALVPLRGGAVAPGEPVESRLRDGVREVVVWIDGVRVWAVFDTGCAEAAVISDPARPKGKRYVRLTVGGSSFDADVRNEPTGDRVCLLGLPAIRKFDWFLSAGEVRIIR